MLRMPNNGWCWDCSAWWPLAPCLQAPHPLLLEGCAACQAQISKRLLQPTSGVQGRLKLTQVHQLQYL